MNDYPEVFVFDSHDSIAAQNWWDTLGDEWVRVNLITDSLGNAVGPSGSSSDLSGGADRQMLAALRAEADVILLGGETVRAEPDCLPRNRDVVIVSKTGNVPLSTITKARGRVTVLHGRSASAPSATRGIVLRQFTGEAIIKAVRALGYRKIVCEGGPTIARCLVDAGLVDEWCQTVSPRVGQPGAEPRLPQFGGILVNIAHDNDGFRYLRHRNGAPQIST